MKLSTGKEIYANREIIGIDDELNIFEGYDGIVYMPDFYWDESESPLTDAECVELANRVIERWKQFRLKHETTP